MELFEEALPLSEGDREIFLREVPNADEKIRRTVESLLEADGELGGFLETPLVRPVSSTHLFLFAPPHYEDKFSFE